MHYYRIGFFDDMQHPVYVVLRSPKAYTPSQFRELVFKAIDTAIRDMAVNGGQPSDWSYPDQLVWMAAEQLGLVGFEEVPVRAEVVFTPAPLDMVPLDEDSENARLLQYLLKNGYKIVNTPLGRAIVPRR